jgi:glycosyltransferase involved in cell wall biosynthesis
LALRLAETHEVTVVTRSNNQEVIESALKERKGLSLTFIYHDLGVGWLGLKKKKFFPVQLYYTRWLFSLGRRLESEDRLAEFDLVHHLTFNSFEIPPLFLRKVEALKVWGPIGGGQIAPRELTSTLSPMDRWKEKLRGWRVTASRWNPSVRAILSKCDLVLFANEETRDLLQEECGGKTGLMVDVGVDPDQFQKGGGGGGFSVLFAGKFEPRKGTRLLLLAFKNALRQEPGLKLRMIGDGPEWAREKQWVADQGLEEAVELVGRCSHAEMAAAFAQADIFVFPSLRDTSGAIVLEAMASEVPTICLDHQGARLMVNMDSGIRVPVRSEAETVKAMAESLVSLSGNTTRCRMMGEKGRARVAQEFDWQCKTASLLEAYQQLVEG